MIWRRKDLTFYFCKLLLGDGVKIRCSKAVFSHFKCSIMAIES